MPVKTKYYFFVFLSQFWSFKTQAMDSYGSNDDRSTEDIRSHVGDNSQRDIQELWGEETRDFKSKDDSIIATQSRGIQELRQEEVRDFKIKDDSIIATQSRVSQELEGKSSREYAIENIRKIIDITQLSMNKEIKKTKMSLADKMNDCISFCVALENLPMRDKKLLEEVVKEKVLFCEASMLFSFVKNNLCFMQKKLDGMQKYQDLPKRFAIKLYDLLSLLTNSKKIFRDSLINLSETISYIDSENNKRSSYSNKIYFEKKKIPYFYFDSCVTEIVASMQKQGFHKCSAHDFHVLTDSVFIQNIIASCPEMMTALSSMAQSDNSNKAFEILHDFLDFEKSIKGELSKTQKIKFEEISKKIENFRITTLDEILEYLIEKIGCENTNQIDYSIIQKDALYKYYDDDNNDRCANDNNEDNLLDAIKSADKSATDPSQKREDDAWEEAVKECMGEEYIEVTDESVRA